MDRTIPEDGEMKEMTLPCRYRIRSLSPGGLRSSTLPVGHGGCPQYLIITSEQGIEKHLFLLKPESQSGNETTSPDFPGRQLYEQKENNFM